MSVCWLVRLGAVSERRKHVTRMGRAVRWERGGMGAARCGNEMGSDGDACSNSESMSSTSFCYRSDCDLVLHVRFRNGTLYMIRTCYKGISLPVPGVPAFWDHRGREKAAFLINKGANIIETDGQPKDIGIGIGIGTGTDSPIISPAARPRGQSIYLGWRNNFMEATGINRNLDTMYVSWRVDARLVDQAT
ncbi:hypothetical protein K504DRAFT_453053 [Pleomassaria siparia CBS 279.74]|uniref:Uncharacterized protein n=1 Tax=Pleomassaria siparia CBS 279.74 TaxID=1314801 RepID=A0A6G1JQ43_9PLEO|nr:hypothetical protein K504DRAFT_453053 [Pleomassaria siparia CBS 279.74]